MTAGLSEISISPLIDDFQQYSSLYLHLFPTCVLNDHHRVKSDFNIPLLDVFQQYSTVCIYICSPPVCLMIAAWSIATLAHVTRGTIFAPTPPITYWGIPTLNAHHPCTMLPLGDKRRDSMEEGIRAATIQSMTWKNEDKSVMKNSWNKYGSRKFKPDGVPLRS